MKMAWLVVKLLEEPGEFEHVIRNTMENEIWSIYNDIFPNMNILHVK